MAITAPAPPLGTRRRERAARRLSAAAGALTTPLVPDDFVALLNLMWARELHGRVEDVRRETATATTATTLILRPGRGWAGHVPGQYVRIGVEVDGVRHWRAYSVTSLPGSAEGRPGCISVTVKALPDGIVSRHLAHTVARGAVVRLAPAEGTFTLPVRRPAGLLFVSAGSGITPVMGMVRQLAAEGRLDGGTDGTDAVLVHSAPTVEEVIFGQELRTLTLRHPGFRLHEQHTDTAGLLDGAALAGLVPDWRDRQTFVCGPIGLLDNMEKHWGAAGLGASLHSERFRPTHLAVGGDGGVATFAHSGVSTDADGGTPLLDVGERAGALLPSGCRMGICFGCVGVLTAGAVRDLRTGALTTAPETGEGAVVQTCVSAAAGACSIDL